MIYKGLKRALDISASGLGLLATAPVTLPAAAAIYIAMGRPIFFMQERPGLYGKSFYIRKFRTMRTLGAGEDMLGTDGVRLTRLGKFLRKTSIDELPTLWNVFKGEMSLVGPRPLLVEYLERYTPEQMRRHDVKPGITGWAQVNGRNALGWNEKLRLDCWYVQNRSMSLDIRILLMTVFKVLRQDGISAEGEATMSEFTGDSPLA